MNTVASVKAVGAGINADTINNVKIFLVVFMWKINSSSTSKILSRLGVSFTEERSVGSGIWNNSPARVELNIVNFATEIIPDSSLEITLRKVLESFYKILCLSR